ncbi:MAG TPA: c-type cytochrome [Rhodocyclaceae bacterium]|nr:c-type cytochrome [Rhodocyclaceae bacterium]
MKLIAATLFAATALVATNAMANADLAKKSNCLACHTADKKLVGPAYQDVAKKYAGDKSAEAKLVEKVKKGGVGVWGNVPMPPNANVKDEDIKTLVKWVLAGAK